MTAGSLSLNAPMHFKATSHFAGGQAAREGARERPAAQPGDLHLGDLVNPHDLGFRGDHGAAGGRRRVGGEEDRHGATGDHAEGHDLHLGAGT